MPAVRSDLFPCELLVDPDAPDPADRRRVYPVRVLVTLDEVLVFRDASPRPELLFRDGLVSFSPATPEHRLSSAQREADPSWRFAVATTDSGHALSWAKTGGCGCGSRLKVLSSSALLRLDAPSPASSPIATAAAESDR